VEEEAEEERREPDDCDEAEREAEANEPWDDELARVELAYFWSAEEEEEAKRTTSTKFLGPPVFSSAPVVPVVALFLK
jgi:hypothetical protein